MFIHRVFPTQVLQYVLLCEKCKAALETTFPHLAVCIWFPRLKAAPPSNPQRKSDKRLAKLHGLVDMSGREQSSWMMINTA